MCTRITANRNSVLLVPGGDHRLKNEDLPYFRPKASKDADSRFD